MKIELNTLGSIGLILLSTKIPLRFRKAIQLIPHTHKCLLRFRLYLIPPNLCTCRKQSKKECAKAKL